MIAWDWLVAKSTAIAGSVAWEHLISQLPSDGDCDDSPAGLIVLPTPMGLAPLVERRGVSMLGYVEGLTAGAPEGFAAKAVEGLIVVHNTVGLEVVT